MNWIRYGIRKIASLTFLAVMVGVLLGVGSFTLFYGEGLSYFSKDPAACKNCHIMQSQFDSWQKASHHTVATCVDCHLPHDFLGKYLAKAENGYNHSTAFTFQNFPEPIRIKKKNSQILQENCLACHKTLVSEIVHTASTTKGDVDCIHCHANVGHGVRTGLGGPIILNELGDVNNESK